ncbi:hypothetical protein SK128_005264 [Halocaridina rubra]|uniref:Uncharacterized protein n=1 Tax=Halocaridina rubra TaxID=373956 RepID=A0AAN9AF62_HALRR
MAHNGRMPVSSYEDEMEDYMNHEYFDGPPDFIDNRSYRSYPTERRVRQDFDYNHGLNRPSKYGHNEPLYRYGFHGHDETYEQHNPKPYPDCSEPTHGFRSRVHDGQPGCHTPPQDRNYFGRCGANIILGPTGPKTHRRTDECDLLSRPPPGPCEANRHHRPLPMHSKPHNPEAFHSLPGLDVLDGPHAADTYQGPLAHDIHNGSRDADRYGIPQVNSYQRQIGSAASYGPPNTPYGPPETQICLPPHNHNVHLGVLPPGPNAHLGLPLPDPSMHLGQLPTGPNAHLESPPPHLGKHLGRPPPPDIQLGPPPPANDVPLLPPHGPPPLPHAPPPLPHAPNLHSTLSLHESPYGNENHLLSLHSSPLYSNIPSSLPVSITSHNVVPVPSATTETYPPGSPVNPPLPPSPPPRENRPPTPPFPCPPSPHPPSSSSPHPPFLPLHDEAQFSSSNSASPEMNDKQKEKFIKKYVKSAQKLKSAERMNHGKLIENIRPRRKKEPKKTDGGKLDILEESPTRPNLDTRLRQMFGALSDKESPEKKKPSPKPPPQTRREDNVDCDRPLSPPPSPFLSRHMYHYWHKVTVKLRKTYRVSSIDFVGSKLTSSGLLSKGKVINTKSVSKMPSKSADCLPPPPKLPTVHPPNYKANKNPSFTSKDSLKAESPAKSIHRMHPYKTSDYKDRIIKSSLDSEFEISCELSPEEQMNDGDLLSNVTEDLNKKFISADSDCLEKSEEQIECENSTRDDENNADRGSGTHNRSETISTVLSKIMEELRTEIQQEILGSVTRQAPSVLFSHLGPGCNLVTATAGRFIFIMFLK